MAYISLLQAIASNDTRTISKMCEPTLYREFYSGLQELNTNYAQIELLNYQEDFDDIEDVVNEMKVSVVDVWQYFGASMNREENRLNSTSEYPVKNSRFSVFMPGDLAYGSTLAMHLMVKLRFETNIKLNAYTRDGKPLVADEDRRKPEVHFV